MPRLDFLPNKKKSHKKRFHVFSMLKNYFGYYSHDFYFLNSFLSKITSSCIIKFIIIYTFIIPIPQYTDRFNLI